MNRLSILIFFGESIQISISNYSKVHETFQICSFLNDCEGRTVRHQLKGKVWLSQLFFQATIKKRDRICWKIFYLFIFWLNSNFIIMGKQSFIFVIVFPAILHQNWILIHQSLDSCTLFFQNILRLNEILFNASFQIEKNGI